MLAPRSAADAASDTATAIATFMRGGSLEATRPGANDVAALKAAAAPGTPIYLSAVLTRPQEEVVAQAKAVRAAGLEPVPHLAVRNFASSDGLKRFLDRLAGEAGGRKLLVIAGDRAEPAGPFHGALEAIDSGLITRSGITDLGISGYPDGHPRRAGPSRAGGKTPAHPGLDPPGRHGPAGPASPPPFNALARAWGVRASTRGL